MGADFSKRHECPCSDVEDTARAEESNREEIETESVSNANQQHFNCCCEMVPACLEEVVPAFCYSNDESIALCDCNTDGEVRDFEDPYGYSRLQETHHVDIPTASSGHEWFLPVQPSPSTGSTVDTESARFDSGISYDEAPRVPIPASQYEAVPGDQVDEYLAQACRRLDDSRASGLTVLRHGAGDYNIGGRRVSLTLAGTKMLVKEENNYEAHDLDWYLVAAAEVEHHMNAGAPAAISQVPRHLRLSFDHADPTRKGKTQRKAAMRLAQEQAALREKDAQGRIRSR